MKALLLEGKGEWTEMRVGETEKPSPGKGEILIKVKAAGLNPVDYKTATGGNPLWSYPHILGLDAAGIVEETGSEVTNVQIGDRVVYHGDLTKKGGFAEYAVTTAHTVSIIPESVSFEDAAALPTAGYTAYQALYRKLRINEGESILIHGGAGGVGGFAVQMAKRSGLTVFTTASAANHEYVKSLGADYAIDYKESDVTAKVMELTAGNGVDAVLDTVSRQNATDSLDCLAFNGRIAYIAGAPDFTKVKPFTKAISYHEIALGAVHQSNNIEQQKDLAVMGDAMLMLVAERQLSSLLEQVISLEEVPEALLQLSERHVKGKIVARVND
ncbi:zinc-binding dehydrogenase [Peribacillus frigoritolerans]|uniref:zinc-binding dehydrogenase n=1 Tax=Peribacillus frigoritolerans TaxID=450367 RepID=UPI00105974B6|nr:zinc-binding dehydrogenase [Peribacillus frigoritolerans]TDL78900.1 zinc-binding alcohol dehydrogenase [Peribacillus frigoritolerans]